MSKKIRVRDVRTVEVVVKPPKERPYVAVIANTLEAFQSLVGGYIEVVGLTQDNVVVCNEEGLLRGLAPNALGLRGTFVVVGRGHDGEFGNIANPRAVCEALGGRVDARRTREQLEAMGV